MEIRNARYTSTDGNMVDVEINHVVYGWIPYTFKFDEQDSEIGAEVREWLKTAMIAVYEVPKLTPTEQEEINKQVILQQLSTLTVTTNNGNTFDAYLQARQDMADAILASSTLGMTETVWRMADNSEVKINLNELKEAHALAIQEYAKIKGIGA